MRLIVIASLRYRQPIAAGYFIDAWFRRHPAVVRRLRDGHLEQALNWQELQDEALQVIAKLGSGAASGVLYPCPVSLAKKATWE